MEKRIRVLVAKPGLDGHDRGAKVVARALRDAGFEVIYTGIRLTPEQISEAALQEDVNVVALSLLSGAHNTLFPRIVEMMTAKGLTDILTIGGVTLPAPNEYKVQLNDLDSSDTGRTEDGVMMRNRVREGIAKISASWAAVSTADCARILHAVKPESFDVAYFFGEMRTARMYAGDRSADLIAAREGKGVWDVSLNLIEF